MFEEEPLHEPEADQDEAVDLGDGEGPRHSVHVVEELVGQRRAHRLVRHPLVDDGDDDSGEDKVEEGVEEGHARFPPLPGQAVGALLRHGNLDVVAVSPQPIAKRVDQLAVLQQVAHAAVLVFRFAVVVVDRGRRRRSRGGVVASWVTVGDPLGMARAGRVNGGHGRLHVRADVVAVLQVRRCH